MEYVIYIRKVCKLIISNVGDGLVRLAREGSLGKPRIGVRKMVSGARLRLGAQPGIEV